MGVSQLMYFNKWKNHFSEMKAMYGFHIMKKGESEDAYTETGSR